MAARLKDSQRLGELPRGKGTALELDVRAAPGSAWPTGGLDIYQTPAPAAPATDDSDAGRGGGVGGVGLTHSRSSSSLGLGVGGALSAGDDWMDSLAGLVTVRCALPDGTPPLKDLSLDDGTTVAALKLKIMAHLEKVAGQIKSVGTSRHCPPRHRHALCTLVS